MATFDDLLSHLSKMAERAMKVDAVAKASGGDPEAIASELGLRLDDALTDLDELSSDPATAKKLAEVEEEKEAKKLVDEISKQIIEG